MVWQILLISISLTSFPQDSVRDSFPLHENITATVFWIGEKGNTSSSWDESWVENYGGIDDPFERNGWQPGGFLPNENPFYVALPFSEHGIRESICKNRWVEIRREGISCYAQWEDVGPFVTDDSAYVFGSKPPMNRNNNSAGIDVSPAVRDFLGMDGMATVSWRFVETGQVPAGPWKEIITGSG